MKVIRLVEDQNQYRYLVQFCNDNGIDVDDPGIQYILQTVPIDKKITNGEISDLKRNLLDHKNRFGTTVNNIKDQFANSTDKEEALNKLQSYLTKIGNYGSFKATNLINVLKNYNFKFIEYFLSSLKYENLSDKDNLVLIALCNPSASKLLMGNEQTFTQLFNLVINNENLGIDRNYVEDANAILFYTPLYKLGDQGSIEDIIEYDVKNMNDPDKHVNRLKLKKDISHGEVGQYKSTTNRIDREISKVRDTFNRFSKDQKIDFLVQTLGMTQQDAETYVNNLGNQ